MFKNFKNELFEKFIKEKTLSFKTDPGKENKMLYSEDLHSFLKYLFEVLKPIDNLGFEEKKELQNLLNNIQGMEKFYKKYRNQHKFEDEFFKKDFQAELFEKALSKDRNQYYSDKRTRVESNRSYWNFLKKYIGKVVRSIITNPTILENNLEFTDSDIHNLTKKVELKIRIKDVVELICSRASVILFSERKKTWVSDDIQIISEEVIKTIINKEYKKTNSFDIPDIDDSYFIYSSHLRVDVLPRFKKFIFEVSVTTIYDFLKSKELVNESHFESDQYRISLSNISKDWISAQDQIYQDELLEKVVVLLIDYFEAKFCVKSDLIKIKYIGDNGVTSTKSEIRLHLPDGIKDTYEGDNHFPRIIEPVAWKTNGSSAEGSKYIVQNVRDGLTTTVKLSDDALDIINKTQNKAFKINKTALDHFKYLDDRGTTTFSLDFDEKHPGGPSIIECELPFCLKQQLKATLSLKSRLNSNLTEPFYKKIFGKVIRDLEDDIIVANSKDKRPDKYHYLINKALNQGYPDLLRKKTYLSVKLKYRALRDQRRLFETHLKMAEVFSDLKLFYSMNQCFRGRQYPLQYLFSRTGGFYKYFLNDYKETKLSIDGFIELLRAYYMCSNNLLEKFDSFFRGKNEVLSHETLYSYFIENQASILELNEIDFLYFSLIEKEILSLKNKDYTTGVWLERDMKASGPTFISMLYKNKHLAEKTNLTTNEPNDFVLYLRSKTGPYFKLERAKYIKKLTKKNNSTEKDVLNFMYDIETQRIVTEFLKNKKLHKYSSMCFFYAQGYRKRYSAWVQEIEKTVTLTKAEKMHLERFSKNYLKFLSFCFPDFEEQHSKFNKCINFFVKHSNKVIFNTVDNSTFSFEYDTIREKTGSRWKPSIGKNLNYRRKVIEPYELLEDRIKELEEICENLRKSEFDTENEINTHEKEILKLTRQIQLGKNDILRGFVANFIHNIDSTFLRMLVGKIYKRSGYICASIHDCYLVHPNLIGLFKEEVKNLIEQSFNTDLEDLLFIPAKEHLIEKYKDRPKFLAGIIKEFDTLINNFKKSKGDLVLKKENINPDNLFPNEHSAPNIKIKY